MRREEVPPSDSNFYGAAGLMISCSKGSSLCLNDLAVSLGGVTELRIRGGPRGWRAPPLSVSRPSSYVIVHLIHGMTSGQCPYTSRNGPRMIGFLPEGRG